MSTLIHSSSGCFVISVCTGYHVNHYLIETLESMFYVKRESGGERGRDIQACDLVNLVECYKRLPLDISGTTDSIFPEINVLCYLVTVIAGWLSQYLCHYLCISLVKKNCDIFQKIPLVVEVSRFSYHKILSGEMYGIKRSSFFRNR